MKNSEFRGLSAVYRYTLTQTLKTKSFIITMVIMILFAGLVFPIMNFVNRDKTTSTNEESGNDSVDDALSFKVYVNSSDITVDYEDFKKKNVKYANVEFVDTADSSETVLSEAENKGEKAVFLETKLELEKGRYFITVNYVKDNMTKKATEKFAECYDAWFIDYKVEVLNLTEAQTDALNTTYQIDEVKVTKFLTDKEVDVLSSSEYNVVYALLMVIYFLIVFSASSIANKVVEEKANRVVEYLLTTVRPMALIFGKVLATLTVTISEIAILALVAVGSNNISASVFGLGGQKSALSSLISFESMQNLNIVNFIIFLTVTAMGILVYGFLAGLCGASVSKMEDIQQGLRTYNVIIVVFFLIAIVSCEMMWTVGLNGFTTFTLCCPFTSPFILPGAIVVGKVNTVIIAVAIVLLAITTALVLKLVSMVYEAIIVMNGDPISLKKMIKIAKDRRKQA